MLIFTLVALLLYPDGKYLALNLGDGSYQECQAAKQKAELQLTASLSVAQLVAVKCQKSIEL